MEQIDWIIANNNKTLLQGQYKQGEDVVAFAARTIEIMLDNLEKLGLSGKWSVTKVTNSKIDFPGWCFSVSTPNNETRIFFRTTPELDAAIKKDLLKWQA